MSNETIVIVGAGHAGGRAAQSMRAAGFEGAVVLVGEEQFPPYERPPLSKELLQTDDGLERARLHDPAWYEEHDIELLTGARAAALDLSAKTVTLADGGTLAYGKLLLTPDARVVVIGGGFIGLECAASARSRGCAVTVLEAADRLMGRAVAPEIGRHFEEIHRGHGVDLRLGAKIAAIDGYGKVASVVLEDDEPVPADVVVIGIGILPNVELAQAAGIACDNGIIVDAFGRTSDPHVWAAGDVANQPNAFLGRHVRLESYQNAQDQAMAVGRNMVSAEPTPYEDSLWVWTDQYDVNLQMLGFPSDYDALVRRGEPDAGAFTLFYMKDGRIVAVNTVNSGRDMGACKRLIATGKAFDPARLADPEVKLIRLAKG